MKKATIYAIAAFLILATSLRAQQSYLEQISTENLSISKNSATTTVAMDFLLDKLLIDKNHLLVITPVIVSPENQRSVEMAPIIIAGGLRNKVLNRPYTWKGKTQPAANAATHLVRKNSTAQRIHYSQELPFEDWQRKARLMLKANVTGCADCALTTLEKGLAERMFPEAVVPVYRMNYIEPEVEAQKQRSETYTAYFTYRQGRYELLPTFENNAAELEKVDRVIREVQADKDLTFTNIEINGYASPEGTYENNMTLSKNRANTFADYLVKKYGLNATQFKVKWHGEDWEGLKKAIEKETFADKAEVLRIINNVNVNDGREKQIMDLSGGQTYRWLLAELFPPLRRNDYTVGFIARPFNVEEAKKLIKTRPKLLSLNEMFLVAQTYFKGSAEYKDVFEVAARMFPNDPVSNINAAAVDLESGNTEAAYKRLEKLKNRPEAWNNLGVALAKKKMYDEANSYFERAAQQGEQTAKENKEELQKLLNSL